jgi:hypothetical protein
LDELWQLLLDKAEAKAESLKASQQLLAFKREADEVDSWIETKVGLLLLLTSSTLGIRTVDCHICGWTLIAIIVS